MLRAALPCLLVSGLAAQEMPKPTPHHEALKRLVGTWDAVVKMPAAPGQAPMEAKGVEVNTLILDGLWIQTEFKSTSQGMPFEGRGLFGYDSLGGKHIGTWVDNGGPWAAVSSGTCTEGCREVTATFEGYGMDGKPARFKEVHRQPDADHRSSVMYVQGAEGKWSLMMEMTLTRRK